MIQGGPTLSPHHGVADESLSRYEYGLQPRSRKAVGSYACTLVVARMPRDDRPTYNIPLFSFFRLAAGRPRD